MNRILILLVFIFFSSCGLLSESNKPVEYNSSSFETFQISKPPNYKNLNAWAVHPSGDLGILSEFETTNEKFPVDVFFIYPTMHSNKNDTSWNADIFDQNTRNYVLNSTIKYQSSAWYATGNLYVPFYRQAHLRVFRQSFWENGGKQAYEMAYQDVKAAFKLFLEEFNDGKPIIIAGHSQGAGHAKRLLQDFFDNKPLQKKLVAAYLIGTKIKSEDFDNIKLMQEANETGGFVSWNTFRLMSERKTKNAILTVSSDWIKDAQCINPITWNNDKTSIYDNHKGFLYLNKKVYPKSVKIENMDTKIYVKLPKMGILKKLMVSTVKDYHKADINLFWEDIRINSLERARTFLENEN